MSVMTDTSEILSQEAKDECSRTLVWGFGMLSSIDLNLLNDKVKGVRALRGYFAPPPPPMRLKYKSCSSQVSSY